MQSNTNSITEESSKLSTPANETGKESLISKEEVYGTPFTYIYMVDKGHIWTMGEFRVTPIFKTKEELDNYTEHNTINIIFTMAATMLEINEKLQKNK